MGNSANMERIMRAQDFSEKQSMGMMMSQKTMELNPRHPIVNELLQKVKDEQTNEDTENLAWLLLDNALMQSGFQPADVDAFAKRALRIIQSGLVANLGTVAKSGTCGECTAGSSRNRGAGGRDLRVPGRGQPAHGHHHQFALQKQGDLPARS